MNENIKDLYIKFHTKRRLFIEEEAEKQFQEMVADNWSDSPSTRMEALFVVMGKRNEQMDFEEFANLLIEETLEVVRDEVRCGLDDYLADTINLRVKTYFGITRSTK